MGIEEEKTVRASDNRFAYSPKTRRNNNKTAKMAYQLYRNTTLGNTLQESLDELIQFQQISPSLALRVLLQFDRSINNALANKLRARISFKASRLNTYRFCDNVWTFMMSDVEFKETHDFAQVDKLKIVACDGRGASTGGTGTGAAE